MTGGTPADAAAAARLDDERAPVGRADAVDRDRCRLLTDLDTAANVRWCGERRRNFIRRHVRKSHAPCLSCARSRAVLARLRFAGKKRRAADRTLQRNHFTPPSFNLRWMSIIRPTILNMSSHLDSFSISMSAIRRSSVSILFATVFMPKFPPITTQHETQAETTTIFARSFTSHLPSAT